MNCTTMKMRFNVFTASTPLHSTTTIPPPSEVGVGVGGGIMGGRLLITCTYLGTTKERNMRVIEDLPEQIIAPIYYEAKFATLVAPNLKFKISYFKLIN